MITSIKAKMASYSLFMAVVLFGCVASSAHAQTYYYYPATPTYYTNSSAQISALWQQIYALTAQLQALQQGTYTLPTYTYTTPAYTYGNYDVSVRTSDVDVHDNEQATFYGSLYLSGAPYAYTWFEYGVGGALTHATTKVRTTASTFSTTAYNLYSNDRYYVRAVAEDPAGVRSYGSLVAFDADGSHSSSNSDEPDASTDDVDDVTSYSAVLTGSIDMNDFEDGIAFFVYGDDEGSVDDVTNEDRYSDVDEDGDALQKVEVDSDIDDDRSFRLTIGGLDNNTDYYYRMCVAYEDEDSDNQLTCGSTEQFETDN